MVFLTWFFNVNETINVLLYGSILVFLAIIGASNLTLIILTIFTVAANNTPGFLEFVDNIYLKLFNTKIIALNSYHTFLYIAMIVFLMIILLIRAIKNKKIPKGRLLIPMFIMMIYSLITLLWADNLVFGLSEIWFIFQGYFIYVIVKNDNETSDKFLLISWFLSLLLLVISFQYFISYSNYYNSIGESVSFFNYWKIDSKAAINLWANPNIVAAIYGVSLVPSLYKYFSKDKLKYSYLFIPLELLIIYGIILTKSQGMFYSLLIGLLFIPLLFIKNRKLLFALIFGAVCMFAFGMWFVVNSEDIFPGLYNMFNDFTTNRIDIYKAAFETLKDPLVLIFGKGLGADRSILEANFFHSWVFQVLITRGLIGFSLVIHMIYLVISILFDSKNNVRYFIAIAIIIYLAHGITDSGFDYQHIGVIYYLLVASLEKQIPENNLLLI